MANRALGQFFTPTWAAELLVKRHFPDLKHGDLVLDPTCGDGRFLMALPKGVRGYGVEIDPIVAAAARKNTGFEIVTGDIRTTEIDIRPAVIVGNPPYQAALIDDIIDRCHDLLDYEGRIGFLLPVYYMQTASKVMDLSRRFSMSQELIPRNIFEQMMKPLMWVNFTKSRKTSLAGFFLYAETDALGSMPAALRKEMVGNQAKAGCWRALVEKALEALGGTAPLADIYRYAESARPTENPWWREQIRKVLNRDFFRVGHGIYSLRANIAIAA